MRLNHLKYYIYIKRIKIHFFIFSKFLWNFSNEQTYVYHKNDKKFNQRRTKWMKHKLSKHYYLSKINQLTLTKQCKFTSFRNVFHWRHETQYSPHSLFLESVSYLKSTCSRIVWKVIERGRGYRNVQSLYQLAWHFHRPPMTPCIFPRISRRVDWVHALTPAHLLSSCLHSTVRVIRTM